MSEAPAKTLAEAVCRVMAQVGYVQKDKQMQGGGSYRYVSVEAVIDALRPEMIREQLMMLPTAVDPLTIEAFEGKNGGRQNRTQVKYTFTLTHAPSQQAAPVVVIGEAIDVGDKSSNKAMTAARKYALIMAFNIETGLDPDYTPSHTQERAANNRPAAQPQQRPAAQQSQQQPAAQTAPAPAPAAELVATGPDNPAVVGGVAKDLAAMQTPEQAAATNEKIVECVLGGRCGPANLAAVRGLVVTHLSNTFAKCKDASSHKLACEMTKALVGDGVVPDADRGPVRDAMKAAKTRLGLT